MDCKHLAEQLLLFRDGQLTSEETEDVRQHLHLCPPCMHLLCACAIECAVDVVGGSEEAL